MKPIIVDNSKLEKKTKKIELLHCLQASKNLEDSYYFSEDNYFRHLRIAEKITRLSSNLSGLDFDLIETQIGSSKNIFLGHWNDGIV